MLNERRSSWARCLFLYLKEISRLDATSELEGSASFMVRKSISHSLICLLVSDSSLSTLEETLLSSMLYFCVNACVIFNLIESLMLSNAMISSTFSPNSLARPYLHDAAGVLVFELWLLDMR